MVLDKSELQATLEQAVTGKNAAESGTRPLAPLTEGMRQGRQVKARANSMAACCWSYPKLATLTIPAQARPSLSAGSYEGRSLGGLEVACQHVLKAGLTTLPAESYC